MCKKCLLVSIVLIFLASCGGTTPAPLPTATLVPTSTQTEVPPTPTATNTPVPSGPCDNPLMSLNVGNRWLYQSTNPDGSSQRVLQVMRWDESVGLNAVITMENLATGVVDEDWVTCKQGEIEDFPLFFTSMMLDSYLDGVFNTYYESGTYSPAYAVFVENDWMYAWEARYLTEEGMCFRNSAFGSVCINRSSSMKLLFETEGVYESVTVPAGTFPQALKVSYTIRMPATVTTSTLATSAPLTVRTTQWYVPFLGLVKSQIDSAGLEYITGQETSFQLNSVVELVEFTSGQ